VAARPEAGPSIVLAPSQADHEPESTAVDGSAPAASLSAAKQARLDLATTGSTSIGGYAELHYNLEHVTGPGESEATIDMHRLVLFLAHGFTDKLSFYSELEVEHALVAPDGEGEVEIEQAYLDYRLLDDALGLRAGVLLVPMGIINAWHEPPSFHGVERPTVDRVIIPSTWREGGIGVFGEPVEGVRYELYLVGGLDPTGFSADEGIRGGRQEVAEAAANGLAMTGRIEVEPMLGLVAGLAGYCGLAGPNAKLFDLAGNPHSVDVPVWGISADAHGHYRGFEARAVAALFGVGDTELLRQAADGDGKSLGLDIGAQSWGAYAEIAYDVLQLAKLEQALLPFVRVERYDTMATINGRPETAADEPFGATELALGATYKPVPAVAFKTDFVLKSPDGPTRSQGRFDLGVGVMF
jgi:hypothetical protein